MANRDCESEKTAWRRRGWLGEGVERDEWSEADGDKSCRQSLSLFPLVSLSISVGSPFFFCLSLFHFLCLFVSLSSLCLHLLCPVPGELRAEPFDLPWLVGIKGGLAVVSWSPP